MIGSPAQWLAQADATVLGLALKSLILLVAFLVGAAVVLWICRRATRQARDRVERATGDGVQSARRKAAITFAVVNVVRVLVFTVLMFVVLAVFGVNIGPVLASAGILGAGLAFGAQSIVRDYLAGFYVLVEDQFSVGDSVEVTLTGAPHPVSGTVVDLTLRRTAMRVKDGSVVAFGNGAMVSSRNRSRGTGVLRVEVEVPPRGTFEEMSRELEDLVESMGREPELARLGASGLHAEGVEPTASGTVQLIVTAVSAPSHRTELEREVRMRMNRRFLGGSSAATDGEVPRDPDG